MYVFITSCRCSKTYIALLGNLATEHMLFRSEGFFSIWGANVPLLADRMGNKWYPFFLTSRLSLNWTVVFRKDQLINPL